MERKVTIALAAVIAGVIVITFLFIVHSPINARRADLKASLSNIKPADAGAARQEAALETLQQKLAAKPQLWKELLAPPAPPPPAPPAPPKLEEMAKDLNFGRQQVGGKVKVTTPGDRKGSFVGVGEVVGGLTVKEISKTTVVLSLEWQGKELTYSKERK
jgi:hypothetical protein